MFNHAIIIPTCGNLDILSSHFGNFIDYCSNDTVIVVALNCVEPENTEKAIGLIKGMVSTYAAVQSPQSIPVISFAIAPNSFSM